MNSDSCLDPRSVFRTYVPQRKDVGPFVVGTILQLWNLFVRQAGVHCGVQVHPPPDTGLSPIRIRAHQYALLQIPEFKQALGSRECWEDGECEDIILHNTDPKLFLHILAFLYTGDPIVFDPSFVTLCDDQPLSYLDKSLDIDHAVLARFPIDLLESTNSQAKRKDKLWLAKLVAMARRFKLDEAAGQAWELLHCDCSERANNKASSSDESVTETSVPETVCPLDPAYFDADVLREYVEIIYSFSKPDDIERRLLVQTIIQSKDVQGNCLDRLAPAFLAVTKFMDEFVEAWRNLDPYPIEEGTDVNLIYWLEDLYGVKT
ncbi:hypothetical protein ABW21_db0208846 [Orbilia brochopaga]|nr:hypothetical protein ABW21_db0208846 [Drechslerella brochopaga]